LQDIQLSKENYERMVNLAPQLICITNLEGYFIFSNPTAIKVLGYDENDMLKLSRYDIIHPEDKAELIKSLEIMYERKKQVANFEFRYKCKDGTYKWIAWSLKIQWDEKLIYSAGHDVTERKTMENNLRISKEKLHNVLNNADVIIMQIDKSGTILLSEGKALSKIGLKPGDQVGKSLFEFNKDVKSIMDKMQRVLNGEELKHEITIVDVTFSVCVTPLKDDKGIPYGCIIVCTDISERRTVEIELESTKKRLQEAQEFTKVGYWEYNVKTKHYICSDELYHMCGIETQGSAPSRQVF
jgi:PAS domain S-box-containing protein